jgi:hypothetical protein
MVSRPCHNRGISLIIVDIVTNRRANLHNEILRVMELTDGPQLAGEVSLFVNDFLTQNTSNYRAEQYCSCPLCPFRDSLQHLPGTDESFRIFGTLS